MAVNGLPNMTYIDRYISDGSESTLSLKNFYNTVLVKDDDNPDNLFRVPWDDFFIEHRDHLMNAVQYYNLPQMMFYKPKMVSYELYGTTELWLALMRLNGFKNISEFHYPVIKIYESRTLKDLINIFFKRQGII